MTEQTKTILVELTDDQAAALAQFLKRVCFSDFEQRAISIDDAYIMQAAAKQVRDALASAGYEPR